MSSTRHRFFGAVDDARFHDEPGRQNCAAQMGSKNPTTSTSTSTSSTYKANPVVQGATQNLVQSAVQQSKTIPGQLVSPTTAQQQQGYNQVGQISGIAAPYLQAATNAITGMPQFNAETIQSYMSPYTSQVVQATMAQLQNQDRQQQQSLTGNAISAGAFGGDRAAVASGILGGQQDLANNATIANLENSGYQNAESELNTQQQTGLQTAQTALNGALNASNANIQAGTQQQQTQTAIDQANVEFPYQNLSWLSSLLGNAGSTLGGTTNGTSYGSTTQTGTSNIGSILGGITSLFSLSDERAKENIKGIGKLFDGTPVVKYNYKGDTTTHVGLLAQDVEKRHPEAVAKDESGIRYVNYDEATKGAEKRRHYDAGGTVQPFGAPFAGILPISSGGMNGQQQSEALNAQLMAAAAGQGRSGTAAQPPLNQIAGVLQNKQSLQGIQNIYQMSGLSGAIGQIPSSFQDISDDLSLPSTGLFSMSSGGFVPRQRFADGGSPYGDLSGVNFDTTPLGSDMTNVPLPMTMPSDAAPVQSAPVQSGAIPVPAPAAPLSGIAAINKVAPPADDVFSRMIGQESGGRQFDANGTPLTSNKGAVGVAQITPGTAPEAAEAAGLPYDPQRLATDRSYNLALGRAYYGKMLKQFGSPELATAAYNAGPGAVQHALAMADKNGGSYSDYLSQETRNYVSNVFGNNGMPKDALAFDGIGAPVSGLAMPPQSSPQSAPQQSGGLGGLLSGITSLFHPGATNDARHQMGGFNPFGLDDTTRHALLATGLDMMASKAHWAGQQIGEGGLAGLNYLLQDKNQTRQNALAQSNIAYQQGMLGIAQRKANIMYQNALTIAKTLNGGQPTSGTPSVGSGVTVPITGASPPSAGMAPSSQEQPGPQTGAPIAATPTGIPNPPVKGDPTFWSRVAPNSNPAFLEAKANQYDRLANETMRIPEQSTPLRQEAWRLRTAAQQIRSNGQVTMKDGSTAVIPGFAESQAQIEAAKNAAAHLQESAPAGILERDLSNPSAPPKLIPWSAVKGQQGTSSAPQPPVDTRLMSKEGATIVANETKGVLDRASQANDSAQSTRLMLAQMRDDFANLPTSGWLAAGPGFQDRAKVAGDINQVLRTLGVKDSNLAFNPQTIASGEELKKLSTRLGFDLARTLGSREAAMIINQATAAVPSGDNSPMGAKRLLAGIDAMAQRQQDWYSFVQHWTAKTGGSTLGAQDAFNKMHPPQQYADNAVISTIPAGAVQLLRQKPALAAQFDQKYGVGVSKMILGAGNGQ